MTGNNERDELLRGIGEQHKQVWQRLFSLLGSAKVNGKVCHELPSLSVEEREQKIKELWGEAGLAKAMPILQKIVSIEEQVERMR